MTVFSDLVSTVANLPRVPKREHETQSANPISLIRSLTFLQLAFFLSGWLAWICDAIDFFSVSLATTRLSTAFKQSTSTITLSITLTLLFRPVGALIFGLLSDRYGRKWPLVANLLIIAAFSLGTGFVKSFGPFLVVRSFFGIGMGGIWGMAASMSLENMPVEARGLFSGFLQLGYSIGYLIIAAINLNPYVALQDNWRVLFWCGSGMSFFAALVRLALPESQYFIDRRNAEIAHHNTLSSAQKSKVFIVEAGKALKIHWIRCIFGVILMTAFNFFSHGSQDLFPTYIQVDKGLSAHASTITTIIGNCGAIVGCAIGGYVSQYLGRRLTIIVCCIWAICWLPLWLLPGTFGPLATGAFMVQAGVQGAYGVVPVYLTEISPVAFRAVWPGVAYQLGNMVASASAQIESTAGAKLKDPSTGAPAYGKVSAILIGVAAGVLILCCLVGREALGAHFEKGRAAFEEDAGLDIVETTDFRSLSPATEKGEITEHEYAHA